MYKTFVLIFLALMLQPCFADSCPTISEIKRNLLKDWKAFDSEDGKPLSYQRIVHFKKNVEQFILAEAADEDSNNGTIHCYYRDKNGSMLDTYLARNNYSPENPTKFWYHVTGATQCAAGMEKCTFRTRQLAQLAKK